MCMILEMLAAFGSTLYLGIKNNVLVRTKRSHSAERQNMKYMRGKPASYTICKQRYHIFHVYLLDMQCYYCSWIILPGAVME